MSPAPAVILGSATGGLSFARSLGRHGVPVWMLSSAPLVGELSRYASVLRLPSTCSEPEPWLETLDCLAKRGARVLIPMQDEYVLLVARNYERLAARYKILMPSPTTVDHIIDKKSQYEIVQAAGIAVPRTFYPETPNDVRRIAAQISFPCIVKPRVSHRWRTVLQCKARIATTPHGLERVLEDVPCHEFLVQEIVQGGDDQIFAYLGYWEPAHKQVAHVILKKMRQYPAGFGDGALFETVWEPQVQELSQRALRAFDFYGIADVEFKFDAQLKTWYFIEVNPRAAGMVGLAPRANVDFAWIAYQHLIGNRPHHDDTYNIGVRMYNEEIDLLAFLELRRRGTLTTRGWLHSLRGAKPMIAAWDDPAPFLHGGLRIMNRVLRPVRYDTDIAKNQFS